MPGTLIMNANQTVDLMKMVRSSLETIRNMLAGGMQSEETISQIQQLEHLEQLLMDQAARLDSINRVLEEFNYSVAHELFAPLRRISGFAQEIKLRFVGDIGTEGLGFLDSILDSSQQMNELIDALMQLSRFTHVELQLSDVDLSAIASEIADELSMGSPQRPAVFTIQPHLRATGDPSLLKIALRKLFDNAWKYTVHAGTTLIEFGAGELESGPVYFVGDNGDGFDMAEYGKLFHPFQHLHDAAKYPGNGIGLTAVKRIIERHGGEIWADGERGRGATFFFTLP